MQVFSREINKISEKDLFWQNSYSGWFWGLTHVFKGVLEKKRCGCLQYIPGLVEKSISCRENPEAATLGVLQKKAFNFI